MMYILVALKLIKVGKTKKFKTRFTKKIFLNVRKRSITSIIWAALF